MKDMKNLMVALFVFVFANGVFGKSTDSPFESISLTTAKEMAMTQNKYIFIDFYADWCVPCRWMDETTYSDQRILKALKTDFVSVKVNIDDFDGYSLKEEYKVKVLPTVIVLDNEGKVIRRFEESMSPSKMSDMLTQLSGNEYKIINNENVAPSNSPNIAPGSNFNTEYDKLNDNRNDNSEAAVKTTKSYRVQVGVFTDYANTEKIVDEFNNKFDEPTVILNDYLNNRTVYKVIVGDYEDIAGAQRLKRDIEEKMGIKTFVKLFE